MRILIDLRCCQSPPPRGGVAWYAEHLTRAVLQEAAHCEPTAASQHEFLLFANGISDFRQHLPMFDAPHAQWTIGRWPNKLLHGAWSWQRAAGSFRDADVVWLPNLNFIPQLPARTRLVVTVHDLSFMHFPDLFTPTQRLWHRLVRPRALLMRADAIVAVSETTKRDVVETYGLPEQKIRVVYPGINADTTARSPHDLAFQKPPEPYILSLSELSPRKNLDGLIAAFEKLRAADADLRATHLIIAGKSGSVERALRHQIARSPVRNHIHLVGPVTENNKRALLARALVFAYPSFWEGFGFPPLEAMAAGVPVVASAAGSLPEVLSDAALLVDPLDPTAIARALARACKNTALRSALIVKGRARAARYAWDAAGAQLRTILTDV